jgi:hypothetical protein
MAAEEYGPGGVIESVPLCRDHALWLFGKLRELPARERPMIRAAQVR